MQEIEFENRVKLTRVEKDLTQEQRCEYNRSIERVYTRSILLVPDYELLVLHFG
jgi:hypothetical protein